MTRDPGIIPPHVWARVFLALIALGMLIRFVVVPLVEWAL